MKTMDIKLGFSDIVTAFSDKAIGSRVLPEHQELFLEVLKIGILSHDPEKDRQAGQHFIVLPQTACGLVSCGVGKRTQNPDDYVIRQYREQVGLYLKRHLAVPTEHLAVVVYTKEAYLKDPDVTPEELEIRKAEDVTHVLVAVLATAGEVSKLSPYRFTANLAGGNLEAQAWTADEIRAKAKEILSFDNSFTTVAD